MAGTHVEYLGFGSSAAAREYRLRVQWEGVFHNFTLAIPHEAFLTRRARYQDGPDICFHKLERELAGCAGTLPKAYLSVTDAEIADYNAAHAPKAPKRAPRRAPAAE